MVFLNIFQKSVFAKFFETTKHIKGNITVNHSEIFEETIPFRFMTFTLVIFILFATFFAGLFIYQIIIGSFGNNTAPDWYFAFMFLTMAGATLIISNMRKLRIHIDARGIRASFGCFHQEYDWDAVVSADRDNATFLRYGGWGIRYTRADGCWRRGYIVTGAPRVALTLNRGWFRQFAFSTNRPEEVMRVIGKHQRRHG